MANGKNEGLIEEIKSRCNIVDVIGRHVVLKKAGNNYKGVCPFHNEKTPSFVVSDNKQIFTCFGCGATGDVIEFVKRIDNLDFSGAIEKLAEQYGITVNRDQFSDSGKKNVYYEINREAAGFFYKNLTQKANLGYEYMQKRGIESSILKKFGIGYAGDSWTDLYDYFKAKGTDVKLLLLLGLVSESKGRYYDKFRNRVIFPIINTNGKVIGFGGRALGDGTPKYLNSPETPIFSKKNNLYGLNLTRQDINKEDSAILVEGYMDVISLYQKGIQNVSASLGTALTESQAAMLKRYTKHIVLAYDGDAAGQAATLRGMDILQQADCKVKVLHIEGSKDPDEFVKRKGKEAFLELVQKAMPFVEYKLCLLKQKYDLSVTAQSVDFLQQAAQILRQVGPVEADAYIREIAKETHISEGAIRLEVDGGGLSDLQNHPSNEMRPEAFSKKDGQKKENTLIKESGQFLLEKNLIKLMLMKSSYVVRIKPYVEVFQNPGCVRIYAAIQAMYQEDEELDQKKLADVLDQKDNQLLTDIRENVYLADREEDVFTDCIHRIGDQVRKKRENEIIQILSLADEELDLKAIETLTLELMELQREKKLK